MDEIPGPPPDLKLLFVGVAPTAAGGQSRGGHFYSDSADRLRRGLFDLLSEPDFGLALRDLSLRDGNQRFHEAGYFFLHAAKVRPVTTDAPPTEAIIHCARRHLAREIEFLRPRSICFLGTNNLRSVARDLFGKEIGPECRPVTLTTGTWNGLAAVTHQPRRGWQDVTRRTLRAMLSVRPVA
ncbi:MAG TPA: uracil-DNA glycosylase family protein [Methylomirabilota bacterium]|nr:uracil-DNA glycosylase family protein [Methylomirabilota bacterium]